MRIKDDGGPAFPSAVRVDEIGPHWKHPGMSLRAYAAIHLRVPALGLPWLDEMIARAERRELAAAVVEGIWANSSSAFLTVIGNEGKRLGDTRMSQTFAREAYETADALIAELKK